MPPPALFQATPGNLQVLLEHGLNSMQLELKRCKEAVYEKWAELQTLHTTMGMHMESLQNLLTEKLDAMWQTLADQTDKMLHHTEEFMNSKMQAMHEAVEKTLLGTQQAMDKSLQKLQASMDTRMKELREKTVKEVEEMVSSTVRLMQQLSSGRKDQETRTNAHILKFDKLHDKMLNMHENLAKHGAILQTIAETLPALLEGVKAAVNSVQELSSQSLSQQTTVKAMADAIAKLPSPPTKDAMDLLRDIAEKTNEGVGQLMKTTQELHESSKEADKKIVEVRTLLRCPPGAKQPALKTPPANKPSMPAPSFPPAAATSTTQTQPSTAAPTQPATLNLDSALPQQPDPMLGLMAQITQLTAAVQSMSRTGKPQQHQ